MELKPTLWRTCRVLANRTRLRMLRDLIKSPPRTVKEMATRFKMAEPVASQYLRLLQSRGLLRGERVGRCVWYSVEPDPSVKGTAELVKALRRVLVPGDAALRDVPRTLTAFTHPRRLLVLQTLARGPRGVKELRQATGISTRALARHMAKLCSRGVVMREGTVLRLTRDGSPLMLCLLDLACESRATRPHLARCAVGKEENQATG